MAPGASSGSSSLPTGVRIPVYELAPASFLQAVEHASSVANVYSNDDGELFALGMAESMGADQVPDGALIVLPQSQPEKNQEIDFSFLASSSLVFLQLYTKPQPRSTYCYVAGYSDDVIDRPVATGAKIRFP
jgi:hypothetical protein